MLPGGPSALADLLADLEVSEFAPTTQRHAIQERQLAALISHHAAHTPAFANRLVTAGLEPEDVITLDGLQKLPPASRRDIQTAGPGFYATHVPKTHLPQGLVKTSGSTGEPVAIRKSALNQLFWSAFTIRDHLWNHRDFAGRMSSIRANIETYAEIGDWGCPVNSLYESGPGQAIPITTPVQEQLRLVEQFQPQILLAYPNNLKAFCEHWEEKGFTLTCIRHLRTIGETVSQPLRQRVLRLTGLQIEDNYSSQESGPIAIQCPASQLYHVMSEALIIEILTESDTACKIGATGRVVITDLHNFASPLIRYDIGDYAQVGGSCRCGKNLPTLSSVLGRERNLLRRPNGDRHWPLVGFHHFDAVAPVRQYQFIQHTLRDIEFRVVSDDELTPSQIAGLTDICANALGHEFSFRVIQSRHRLPVEPNGKFEEFVCRIP